MIDVVGLHEFENRYFIHKNSKAWYVKNVPNISSAVHGILVYVHVYEFDRDLEEDKQFQSTCASTF